MRGRALLVATSQYRDQSLSTIVSTRIDARGLREALSDPLIGGMKVSQCIDGTCQVWREHIHEFFADATREELLLLYVTGHAIKDRDGKLYFAAADTRTRSLIATGIPASFVQDAANDSLSRRIVMILDTCYSGAFAKGLVLKSKPMVNTGEYFREGTGKIVITASDAIQYALAGDPIDGRPTPSAFTKHVIEGLRSGRADLDGDGLITSEELFKYVSEALHHERVGQKPQRWCFGVQRDLVIALNPNVATPCLPAHIQKLLADPKPGIRVLAVDELMRLMRSENPLEIRAAEAALKGLLKDKSVIAEAAQTSLSIHPPPRPVAVVDNRAPPGSAPTYRQLPQSELQRSAYRSTRTRPPSGLGTSKGLDVGHRARVPETWHRPDPWRNGRRLSSRLKIAVLVLAGLVGLAGLLGAAIIFDVLFGDSASVEDGVALPQSNEAALPQTTMTADVNSMNVDSRTHLRANVTPSLSAAPVRQSPTEQNPPDRWIPGQPKAGSPHVIAGTKPNHWSTESGYSWLNDEPSDLRVVWTPGVPDPQHAHVVASDTEGEWTPANGYEWVSTADDDFRVKWMPGKEHTEYPHVVAGAREGKFVAEPGYEWAHPDDPKDFTVRAL